MNEKVQAVDNMLKDSKKAPEPANSDMDDFEVLKPRYDRMNHFPIHTKAITSMKLNQTGQLLATASEDGSIKIFDLIKQKEVSNIYNHGKVGLDLEFAS